MGLELEICSSQKCVSMVPSSRQAALSAQKIIPAYIKYLVNAISCQDIVHDHSGNVRAFFVTAWPQ